MTTVSVIIPVFNPSIHLQPCLESVLSQDVVDFEVIVVDDGSNNGVLQAVLRNFSNKNLRVITLPSNRGVAFARNQGICDSTGAYISFIDQDDLWPPNKLEIQSEYLNTHATVDYVIGRQVYFLSAEQSDIPPWLRAAHLQTSLPGYLPGTFMVRRSSFETIGFFDEALTAGTDDVDWFFRAKDYGLHGEQLEFDLLYKRIHGDNLSQHVCNHQRELLRVVAKSISRQKNSHG